MKILVTGGAGYIGSILVEMLLQKNYEVTAIDNFCYEQNTLANCCFYPNFKIINSDIRKLNELEKIIKSHEFIIPLAALVGAPICKYREADAISINLEHNLNLFKIIDKDQKIIMPTTNSAYGKGESNEVFDENSELNPISIYAKHKVVVEENLQNLNNFISLRLATVFGASPRVRLDLLVNNFVHKAFTDGYLVLFESNFKRNYIHVRDVCRAFVFMIENFKTNKNNIFNLGLESANLSKKELCHEISKHINFVYREEEFKKDEDQRNYIVSNKKILSTGFKPQYNLSFGIQELLKCFVGLNLRHYKNF
jgi:nucleoside-diphosphate-sugar epimerase